MRARLLTLTSHAFGLFAPEDGGLARSHSVTQAVVEDAATPPVAPDLAAAEPFSPTNHVEADATPPPAAEEPTDAWGALGGSAPAGDGELTSVPQRPSIAAPAPDDPAVISYSRLLDERPDVLRAFYEARSEADPHSSAWAKRVGAATPEAYAKYWYAQHGVYEGYNQGPTTAGDNVSLERILHERPDVLRGFYEGFFGAGNDRHSSAWVKRVGGDTPEAYAKYWYEKYGKWEGYSQSDKAAAESIDVHRLLDERPDVFRGFFTEFYGPNNDRKSSAWVERVGGDTVEDYAKYWYVTYGKSQGYTQHAAHSAPAIDEPAPAASDSLENVASPPYRWPGDNDPSLDPWNHPAIYPDWQPPYAGWEPPMVSGSSAASAAAEAASPPDGLVAGVGQSLTAPALIV